eukprot:c25047_g1_i1 orf=419-1354(-)
MKSAFVDGNGEPQQVPAWIMDGSYKGPRQLRDYSAFHLVEQDVLEQHGGIRTSPVLSASSSDISDSCSVIQLVPSSAPVSAPRLRPSPTIAYRPIRPSDFEILREIHEALFPIKYEAEFFWNVVNGHGIISWAAVDTSRSGLQCDEIIGFVTVRVVSTTEIDASDMLGYELTKTNRNLIYILTLGVIQPYRKLGIASSLIWEVIKYASTIPICKAVYLHVISYNQPAINFYKKNSFQCLRKLHSFYFINGHHYDAYLYIYYVNGGRPPCLALDFLLSMSSYLWNVCTSISGRFFWTREVKKATRWQKKQRH